MEARFLQTGNTIDYTPSSAVTAGDVIVEGGIIGVSDLDIAADALGTLTVTGLWEVTKATGVTFTLGDLVYWNASTGATATTSDTLMGVCAKTAGAELVVNVLVDKGESEITALAATVAGLEVDDIARKVVTKDDDATLTLDELNAGMVIASKDGVMTITLPTASATYAGCICTIVRTVSATAVTITDGTLSNTDADAVGDCVTVGCTGAAWYVVSSTIA